MDKTKAIWVVDPSAADQVCVGEIGGIALGLYNCRFGNKGTSIFHHRELFISGKKSTFIFSSSWLADLPNS